MILHRSLLVYNVSMRLRFIRHWGMFDGKMSKLLMSWCIVKRIISSSELNLAILIVFFVLYFFFLLTSMYDYTKYLFRLTNKGTRMITGVVLVSLFLTLSRFHTLLWYFFSWLWRSYCQLGLNLNSLTFSSTQYHLKHRTITSATTLANKKINPSGHLPPPS